VIQLQVTSTMRDLIHVRASIHCGLAKKRLGSRDLALVASFAALIAVLGLPGGIQVFGNAVPVTLQTLGIMLASSILGWKRGALSVVVLLVLVAGGCPCSPVGAVDLGSSPVPARGTCSVGCSGLS
jgi:biotin transport system substrate-specific component